jgi:2-polyprenyl-6-hydroxyphenyl methylase/3-demethylubiquinone-9 3-methyltransferase
MCCVTSFSSSRAATPQGRENCVIIASEGVDICKMTISKSISGRYIPATFTTSTIRQWFCKTISFRSFSFSSSSSSVSRDEVENFSKMSRDWWDYKRNPLITMNPTRMSYILEIILSHGRTDTEMKRLRPLEGLTALDVGCGGGLLSESLARLGASVTAIDPSVSLVEVAKQRCLTGKHPPMHIDYKAGVSVEQLAADMHGMPNDNLFDIICVLEVIEHTANPISLLQAASSLLKRHTGILFISTINRTIKSYAIAIVGAEYISGKVPTGTHDWNQFYSPKEIEAIAKSADLQMLDVCGMTLIPSSLLCGPMLWKLDKNDLDVNWIASYTTKLKN